MRQSAAKHLKQHKSMVKVQRIGIEIVELIIYPRVRDITTL